MIRGLYTAASAMIKDTIKQDTISNNLANLNTVGYKRHNTIHRDFKNMLLHRMHTPQPELNTISDVSSVTNFLAQSPPVPMGYLGMGSQIGGSYVDHENGAFTETGNPLDVALQGEGFFVVEGKDGLMYSRNGSFTLNNEGELTTHEGYRVVGEQGPIKLDVDGKVEISLEGDIFSVKSVNNQVVKELKGRLQLVDFSDYQQLLKRGNSFYMAPDNMPALASTANTLQRNLEMSNVDLAHEMVNMITAMRSYELGQKAIHTQDEMSGKVINEVGAPAG